MADGTGEDRIDDADEDFDDELDDGEDDDFDDDDEDDEFDDEDDDEFDDDEDDDDDDDDDEPGERDEYEPGDVNTVGPSAYEAGDVNTVGARSRRGRGTASEDRAASAGGEMPVEVLTYLARAMSDDPDAVVIRKEDRRGSTVLRLHVAPRDMGRVIGRRGRTAQAIRTLVGVAGAREGVQTMVDIVDD